MLAASLTGLDKKRLRLWVLVFFLALALPTSILTYQAYSQLKWEAFHRHRLMAEELAARIDRRLLQRIESEEARSFTDYTFLNVAGDPKASFLQRSPLSAYPVNSALPGVIGYFQIDTKGRFSSPLLPQLVSESARYGISKQEYAQREALQTQLLSILSRNRLVQAAVKDPRETDQLQQAEPELKMSGPRSDDDAISTLATDGLTTLATPAIKDEISSIETGKGDTVPAEEEALLNQKAFDMLNEKRMRKQAKTKSVPSAIGHIEDLKLESPYRAKQSTAPSVSSALSKKIAPFEKRTKRKERSALPEQKYQAYEESHTKNDVKAGDIRISIFESEIDAFALSMLDSGHFVIFRKVWRDGQRYIQGALIEPRQLFTGIIEPAFLETALSQMSELAVVMHGNILTAFSDRTSRQYFTATKALQGALLYQTRLSAPLGELELIFSINRLPAGPAGTMIAGVATALFIVLIGGFYLMYRLGLSQITLAQQQQDFVSAVSHELKTPLTSIRMYGEMLREGWADENKKQTYYDYIYTESERLSRLISNVLQLARMTRNEMKTELKAMSVAELMDGIHSKVSSQIENSGFELILDCNEDIGQALIRVDADYFSQIIINLVDNAIKFSAKAELRRIEIRCRLMRNGEIVFSVRDHGPGIARDQMKKIFSLFYRSENELSRETTGTGIGLALVHQLAASMHAQVDVFNQQPGAEFRVSFPGNTE